LTVVNEVASGAVPSHERTPKRPVDGDALGRSQHAGEGGDLSEFSPVFAGIEHCRDDLAGRPMQNPLPIVQEPPSMGVNRPHPRNVPPGDLYDFGPASSQFFCDSGVKKQTSLLIAGQRRSDSGIARQSD